MSELLSVSFTEHNTGQWESQWRRSVFVINCSSHCYQYDQALYGGYSRSCCPHHA